MPAPQNLKNHVRFDPLFHFFIIPVLLLNFFAAIHITVRHWPHDQFLHLWLIVLAFALIALAIRGRDRTLRVQDRVIRVEERLRLASLLPPADLAHLERLTGRQLIALRFASDSEIPALVHKVLTQNLDAKAIKQNIVSWRPDYERV